MDQMDEMRRINEAQRQYYETGHATDAREHNSWATNLYRRMRQAAHDALPDIDATVHRLHRKWLPPLTDKRVLDLGAGTGTPFALQIADNAREYIACDLSESSLATLEEKLEEQKIRNARTLQADFLDEEFPVSNVDVVYAHSVLHHFKYLSPVLRKLKQHMIPGGVIVTRDPLVTWPPYALFRRLYQTVQSDSAWEHPLTRDDLETIAEHFHVRHVQGLIGRSKWALLWSSRVSDFHQYDLDHATNFDAIGSCLQVAMCLQID
jgi:SAM-dependent methyltransferase